MARSPSELLESFVFPLLGGGPVVIDGPLKAKDLELILATPMAPTTGPWDSGDFRSPKLLFLRLRRGQLLVADPALPDPDADEVRLWMGLYNTLVFDHPDRDRVWSRSIVWRRVEGTTRSLLTLPAPTTCDEVLARHVSVGAFLELHRQDMVVGSGGHELRAMGQELPRRILRMASPADGIRNESVGWHEQPHAPESQRLIEDALRASPLTCVLQPRSAPPGWSPLAAAEAFCSRAMVRAICHRWAAEREWVAVGGAVAGALLPSLPSPIQAQALTAETTAGPLALPGAVLPADPRVLAGVAGALIHLHFLKVLELDARLGVAAVSRDPGVTAFLALPLVLPFIEPSTGSPLGGLPEPADAPRVGHDHGQAPIARRWTEYLDHLQELVPKSAVDNLLATLVPRIVQTS